ncbi:MAG TPA: hypothetical protein DD671_07160 [Balneolaceae bacterium]|nr:hypothetical protein [Balneolaceae bacterium]
MHAEILALASRIKGVTLDEIKDNFGFKAFDVIDELSEENEVFLDDRTGIVYAAGTNPSPCLNKIIISYMEDNK